MDTRKVVRFLMCSPSSAVDCSRSKSARAGNAAIHKCRKVTPEMIAYAAIQVTFELLAM